VAASFLFRFCGCFSHLWLLHSSSAASALSPLPSLSLFLLYFSLTKKIFYRKRGYETEAEDDRAAMRRRMRRR
jgi:hypothetical protein